MKTKAFAAPALAAALAVLAPTAAFAQEEGEGLDVSATATIVSDYRYRGVSLSNRDPALQGSVDLSYNGFYAGVWASTVARTADSNIETDLYVGYAGDAGLLAFDVGALYYTYPGGDGSGDILELTGSLAHTIGPARLRASAAYAPDQENLDGDNLYLSADALVGVPTTPLSFTAQIGRERGSFYGAKTDWSLGLEYSLGLATLGLAYHDSDLDHDDFGDDAKAGIVATASVTF